MPAFPIRRAVTLAAVLAATAGLAAAAQAGQCPADKRVEAGKGQPMSSAPAKAVTDTVLSHIDLAHEQVALKDRQFRLRRLVVQPGGVVPWHSHGERPALIYIVSGEITEYASNCAVPITHKAGEAAMESHGLAHWWKNNGSQPVVLLSADIFPVQHDPKMM
jgi:quercetin dioxygenase-like cupin family protein